MNKKIKIKFQNFWHNKLLFISGLASICLLGVAPSIRQVFVGILGLILLIIGCTAIERKKYHFDNFIIPLIAAIIDVLLIRNFISVWASSGQLAKLAAFFHLSSILFLAIVGGLAGIIGFNSICFALSFFLTKIEKLLVGDLAKEPEVIIKKEIITFFIKIAIFIFAVYLVCLLTYFPGVGMNDALWILSSGTGMARQHPLVYCLLITFFRSIGDLCGGNYNISIAFYSLTQLMFVSIFTSGIITWIFIRSQNKVLKIASVIYYTLVPLFPMYAISMVKDTPWSLFIVVYLILIFEAVRGEYSENRKFWIFTAVVTVCTILFRNNGVYIVIPSLLLILWLNKPLRKRIYRILVLDIVIFAFIGILSPKAMFQEKAGIPLQQICAVIANDGDITDEQAEFIGNLMPLDEIKENYNPYSVDSIKWSDGFNSSYLDEHSGEFLKIWAQMLPKNFAIYVKAYLDETLYFWAPIPHTTQAWYSIEQDAGSSFLTNFIHEKGIHDSPIIKGQIGNLLRSYYEMASHFLTEGMLWWIVVLSFVIIIIKNKNLTKYICIYSPLILLWLTIMISVPVAQSLRYVLAFAYALPILSSFLFIKPISEKTGC